MAPSTTLASLGAAASPMPVARSLRVLEILSVTSADRITWSSGWAPYSPARSVLVLACPPSLSFRIVLS
jgi:hypothetical protein